MFCLGSYSYFSAREIYLKYECKKIQTRYIFTVFLQNITVLNGRFVTNRSYILQTAERLASVYATPEDIDLWIGALLEEPVIGGLVGPTFANIIADQFSRSKKGDRYFYEYGPDVNPGAFTPGMRFIFLIFIFYQV